MAAQGPQGLERIIKATKYSYLGLTACYKSEAAFRQELFLAAILAPVGLWLGETGLEKALLICVLFVVLIVELLNTGIEAVVDRFGDEIHELSGMAKDFGSAAVFVSLANVIAVWVLILIPKFT